jgi:glycerophosphoryl diester phosphodiesterase
MVLRIGHRGAAGYEPENTLASFRKALALGVDMIELDVHLAKTGELVVLHDESVDRTTDGKGPVASKTLKELKALRAGGVEKIPTLEEVLNLIDKACMLNIELKGKHTAAPAADTVKRYVEDYGWDYDRFLLSSFDLDMVIEAKNHNPNIRTGFLFETLDEKAFGKIKESVVFSVNPEASSLNPLMVRKIHSMDCKVYAWLANSEKEIQRLIEIGVDGIFSDYPDRIPL